MRVGQNPAKFVDDVAQPADVTVTVVNFIPFLSGFYEQSLEVLKACLYSIRGTADLPCDLMVFDNHSCVEVLKFLVSAHEQGIIQYLVLSEKNIGKVGAWNYMFGAAQGKFIAFSDADILFRPGWLSGSLALMETFPNVGMVTARPLRTPDEFSQATLRWGSQQSREIYQEGSFLDWETYLEHTDSIGMTRAEAQKQFSEGRDHLFTYKGQRAYAGAAHFQFLARKEVLAKIKPLPSEKPMRGERSLDIAIDSLGLLRLCTAQPQVMHMGNRLPAEPLPVFSPPGVSKGWKTLAHVPGIRRLLLWLYNQIFKIYFHDVE
jgi:hypothetical protein